MELLNSAYDWPWKPQVEELWYHLQSCSLCWYFYDMLALWELWIPCWRDRRVPKSCLSLYDHYSYLILSYTSQFLPCIDHRYRESERSSKFLENVFERSFLYWYSLNISILRLQSQTNSASSFKAQKIPRKLNFIE